jgi:hypothetical protein
MNNELLYFPRKEFSSRFGVRFYTFELASFSKKKLETDSCCSPTEATFYEINVLRGKGTWSVQRRFSDFMKLLEDLKELDTTLTIQGPIPVKSVYHTFFPDPIFMEQRRASLEKFLEKLLLACHGRGTIAMYRPLVSFLNLDHD